MNTSSLHAHAEWQASGDAPARTVTRRDAWNETSFDPYAATANLPALLSGSRNEDPSAESENNISGRVSVSIGGSERLHTSTKSRATVERKVRRSPRVSAMAASRGNAGTLVTAASSHVHVSPIDASAVVGRALPAITPHEHDASLALASLGLQPAKPKTPKKRTAPKQKTAPPKQTVSTLPVGNNDTRTFPELVHAMVTHLNDTQPDLGHWSHEGEAFVIRDPKNPRLEDVLLSYFRHRNYSSLQRQLNMYGWVKKKGGKYTGAFYNKDFRRDSSPSELASITRKGQRTSKASRAKKRTQQQDRDAPGTGEDSMDAATFKEGTLDSVTNAVVAKPDSMQESATEAATGTTTGPAKKRLKGEASFADGTTPHVSRIANGAVHNESFVSQPKEGEIPASPIAFEGISFAPEQDWRNAQNRHPADERGEIRMTVCEGKSVQTSPIIPPFDSLVPFAGHDAPRPPPSPILPRQIRPEERVPPPPQLLRNVSSNGFIPTPVPLERHSSSDSAFLRPFVGMTTALASALACEETLTPSSLGGFDASVGGNQALFH